MATVESSGRASAPEQGELFDWTVDVSPDDILHAPTFPSVLARADTMAVQLRDEARQRRSKAIATLAPIVQLDQNKGRRESPAADYDLRELALAAIELVVYGMAEGGITSTDLITDLQPYAEAQQWGRTQDEYEQVARIVLDALRSEIQEHYGDYASTGDYVSRDYKRRLIEETRNPNDEFFLRASDEAINVIVDGLNVDVESAQEAAEAAFSSLVARGKLGKAAFAAREAYIRSVQYEARIRDTMTQTRRNISLVDWQQEAQDLIDSANTHLRRRLEMERAIMNQLDEMQLQIGGRDLAGLRQLASLREVLERCTKRHTQLHSDVIGAYSTFLDEQARQSFLELGTFRLISFEEDLFRPLIGMPMNAALEAASRTFSSLSPQAVRMPRLAAGVALLLKSPLDRREPGVELDEPVFLDDEDDGGISPELQEAADRLLAPENLPANLSDLLAQARQVSDELAQLVAIRVLEAYGPDIEQSERDRTPFLLASRAGVPDLDDPCFSGPDFHVRYVPWTEGA